MRPRSQQRTGRANKRRNVEFRKRRRGLDLEYRTRFLRGSSQAIACGKHGRSFLFAAVRERCRRSCRYPVGPAESPRCCEQSATYSFDSAVWPIFPSGEHVSLVARDPPPPPHLLPCAQASLRGGEVPGCLQPLDPNAGGPFSQQTFAAEGPALCASAPKPAKRRDEPNLAAPSIGSSLEQEQVQYFPGAHCSLCPVLNKQTNAALPTI